MAKQKYSKINLKPLEKFIGQNDILQIKKVHLQDTEQVSALNWKGLSSSKKTIIDQLAGYQRLLNIVPIDHPELALLLLANKHHSALQITAKSKEQFLQEFANRNDHQELLARCYDQALSIRTKILLQYINKTQNSKHSVV